MPKIRNASGEDRLVAALAGRLVIAGSVIDVPTDDVYGFTQQVGVWEPADKTAQKVHDRSHAAYLRAVGIDIDEAKPEPDSQSEPNPTPDPEPADQPAAEKQED